MPLGRPITLSSNVASKTISITATAGQTLFQPSGGYRINEIAVYRNGTRLVDGQDFTARDGASVTLLLGATVGDILEFQIFDSFNVSAAINDNGNQTLDGALVVTLLADIKAFLLYANAALAIAIQFVFFIFLFYLIILYNSELTPSNSPANLRMNKFLLR